MFIAGLSRKPRRRLTGTQDLRGIVLRMVATNALSGALPDVTFAPRPDRVRSVSPTPSVGRDPNEPSQRLLETVPSAPKGPLPRGSLLDLRV